MSGGSSWQPVRRLADDPARQIGYKFPSVGVPALLRLLPAEREAGDGDGNGRSQHR